MNLPKRMKIASSVWTVDPEGNKRFLIRHNRPFDGYDDEWTILFGNVDEGESSEDAAIREVGEEYGVHFTQQVTDLGYKIEYEDKGRLTEISFYALKVKSIDVPIRLNQESIGYDWMILDKAMSVMQYDDESTALGLVG